MRLSFSAGRRTLRLQVLGCIAWFACLAIVGCQGTDSTAVSNSEQSASDRGAGTSTDGIALDAADDGLYPAREQVQSMEAVEDAAAEMAAVALEKAGVKLVRKGTAVVEADLGSVVATDAVASDMSQLPALVKLTVRESNMTVAGWRELGKLSKLEQADLRDCAMTNNDLLALTEALPRLKALRLSGKSGKTQIDDAGLANLGKCSQLKLLAVDGLWISGDGLQHIGECKEMAELYVAGTLVDDATMPLLAKLPKLSKLRLAKTSVSGDGLQQLAALPLVDLDLSECTQILDAAMPVVAQFSALRRLNLWRNSISDAGVASLAGLTGLEWLNLDNTHMGDGALQYLSELKKLTFLHLGSTAVTNAGMPKLSALTALKELKVTRTAVTEEGIEPLQSANPGLAIQLKYVDGAQP